MHDSHGGLVKKCATVQDSLRDDENKFLLSEFASRASIAQPKLEAFTSEAIEMLTKDFQRSNPVLQRHEVNIGINQTGAMCFSYLRADFGISREGKPYLYEINEFPFANTQANTPAGRMSNDAYRDLFKMIGIAEKPLVPAARAEYERKHKGGWVLLETGDS